MSKNFDEIAKKYGGTVSIDDLAKKYGGQVTETAPTKQQGVAVEASKPPSFGEDFRSALTRFAGQNIGGTAADLAIGGVKGLFNTGLGINKLLGTVPRETTAGELGLSPEGTAQKAGYVGEQIGEFMVPGGQIGKFAKGAEAALLLRAPGVAQKLGMATQIGTRAALEGASAGAITAAQSGGDMDASTRNAGIAAALTGAIPLVGKVAGPVARKMENSVLRPSLADVKDGFKIDNVFKYNVGGTLGQTAQRVHSEILTRVNNLKGLLKAKPVDVDVIDALTEAAKELGANPAKTVGLNSKMDKAVDFWLEELERVAPNGKINLADANEIKRSVGRFGAWISGARDPESGALEKVSNIFYTKLRTAIEKAANDPGVREINKQLGELIPIEQAVIRRIPVAERNNILSLTDVILTSNAIANPSNLWLFAVKKATTSGRAANQLNKAANQTGAAAGVIARGNAGRRSLANQPVQGNEDNDK